MIKEDGRVVKRPTIFYLLAAFISSLIVFSAGIGLGLLVDELKTVSISSNINDLQNSIVDAELEMLLFNYFGGNISCNYLLLKSEDLSIQSSELGDKLYLFEQSKRVTEGEYLRLKEDYTRILIKNWITLEDIKKLCDANYSTILYFYSNNNCSSCENQAYVLDYYKRVLKNKVMTFAIDGEINVSVAKMLILNYGVTVFPSLVINGVLYPDYQDSTRLAGLIGSSI